MVASAACGIVLQCLQISLINLLSRLSRLSGRKSKEHEEVIGGEREAGLLSCCKKGRNKWSLGKLSEPWAKSEKVPWGEGLELSLPGMGIQIWTSLLVMVPGSQRLYIINSSISEASCWEGHQFSWEIVALLLLLRRQRSLGRRQRLVWYPQLRADCSPFGLVQFVSDTNIWEREELLDETSSS